MSPTPPDAPATLEHQVALTSGADVWTTKELPGIPSIMLTDGPHGVRKQRVDADPFDLGYSEPATCFPPAVALGSTFDPALLERVGAALGAEARALGVGVLLGPGVNLKRSPLCGRNFEYLSEDPLVSGVLGSALVRGIQSQGVGASLKHFAANNQETDRMRVSADVDERPLREIYLRGFQRVVEQEQPWTVMCSYNRLNGVPAAENAWLLSTVLRTEWGFDGVVVSDWGAVGDRVASIRAGLDLTMPASGGRADATVAAAVRAGELDATLVAAAARRVTALVGRVVAGANETTADLPAHHALAREAAGAGIVLLRNEGEILPLDDDTPVAVIGALARTPRYQGAGSSLITPTRLDDALTEIGARSDRDIPFAPGYDDDGTATEEQTAEAVALAASAEVVLLFLGVTAAQESEGFDREHLELPAPQSALLDAVVAANPRTVVILSNGGVVRLSGFADRVPAIVEGWLLGQAGGGAIADVLYGATNPSGRLAETIPLRLQDGPSFLDFGGEHGHARYGEGIFVGYRWYDARDLDVSFPFGHGLSYTTFAYGPATVIDDAEGDTVTVHVAVTNTGPRDGAEVVQVYVSLPDSAVARAPLALCGFAKVRLAAGERREVPVSVRRQDLAYWDTRTGGWVVEDGEYRFSVGASSRDIRTRVTHSIVGDTVVLPVSRESTIGELLAHPVAGDLVLAAIDGQVGDEFVLDPAVLSMIATFPIGRLAASPEVPVSEEQVDELLAAANAPRVGDR